ncbi:hypothetical protein DW322_19920 [Rhodococcus rhodnii]|uniref:O-acyltransferase WSD1 C-terminal domain-containing protein n=2 Tax=Rhodococcus rhodnii TaxID=38312 RepID=R7WRI0_9NOCA|nr:hypothetical protein [Rhodococcus rhodnii]EOM77937.1 hypothetical protein Rrhod_0611 [Rhodococcus rhodnii LMG 5362]TXG92025.1 hypothetical protein DW322_19920 [Rhodococcus rhodnii]
MRQIGARDAQALWVSRRIRTDQFQLYCFDGGDAEQARGEILLRAATVPELGRAVCEVPGTLDLPYLVPGPPPAERVLIHAARSWREVQTALAASTATSLSARAPWRVEVYPGVTGAPGCDGPALVAVFVIAHFVADGVRAGEIARTLFGDGATRAERMPVRRPGPARIAVRAAGHEIARSLRRRSATTRATAARAELDSATEAGAIAPPPAGRELTRLDADPGDAHAVRVLVRDRASLTGPGVSVTAGACTAISLAIERYLTAAGDDVPASLGAELPVAARVRSGASANQYANASVTLAPGVRDLAARAAVIAADLAAQAERIRYRMMLDLDGPFDAASPRVLHREVGRFPLHIRPPSVSGNTVVSSVARGAADLVLGGGTVRFTSGFPGLSPAMALTHGVHGIGETVAIGVHAGLRAVPDPDGYTALLGGALDEVAQAVRETRTRR